MEADGRALPLGPHLIESDLSPLGPGVLFGAAVRGLVHLQPRHGQTGGVHAAGRHGQHPRPGGRAQCVEEEARQQERRHHLHGDGQLHPVARGAAIVEQRTGIVDEGIEPAVATGDLYGRGPDGVEIAHVGDDRGDRVVAGRLGQPDSELVRLLLVAGHQHQRRPVASQLRGGGQAQPRGWAGDGDHASREVVRVEVGPPVKAPAQPVPDVREGGEDGRLDDPIDDVGRFAHETSLPARARSSPPAALSPIRLKIGRSRGSASDNGNGIFSVAS